MFQSVDSYNTFIPIVYLEPSYNVNAHDGYSPSVICADSWDVNDMSLTEYICSLYGAPPDSDDSAYHTPYTEYAWADWGYYGRDEYTGDSSHDNVGYVDVTVYSDRTMEWDIVETSSTNFGQVLALHCGASDYCVDSGDPCATDLDCCQTAENPMFCDPEWSTCYHTVQCHFFDFMICNKTIIGPSVQRDVPKPGLYFGCLSDVCVQPLFSLYSGHISTNL